MSSGKSEYQEDDIVFAMVTGYPWWPGFITEKYSKKNYKVTFFGDFSYSDLGIKQIKPFARGLKKADPNNKELTDAIQSAKRVFEGHATIDEEHQKVNDKIAKSRKTRPIKKKKGTRRQNKSRKLGTSCAERTIKIRTRRRMKNRLKDDVASQSMIQETTYKRRSERSNQKRREARLGRSMDQKILEDSDQEEENGDNRVLEELYEQKSATKNKASGSKSKTRAKPRETRARARKSAEKLAKTTSKKDREEEKSSRKGEIKEVRKPANEKNKEEPEKEEKEVDNQIRPESEQKEEMKETGKEKEEQTGEIKLEEPVKESPVKSEAGEKMEKQGNEEEGGSEQEELKEKFFGFEKELLNLLNEMQSNKPIPKIEENLKEWFNQISQINRFSPIVSTDIGKHLSKMSQICQERLNEKQIYNKILSSIEHLKHFIITQITINFFNMERTEEIHSRLVNEDSIITTKKNDPSHKMEHGDFSSRVVFESNLGSAVDEMVRKRIQKKLAKTISKMTGRDTICKKTCITLGERIEEVLFTECAGQDDRYRENVLKLLDFMKKSKQKFIREFILQKNNKCDVQLLRDKVLQFLRMIN